MQTANLTFITTMRWRIFRGASWWSSSSWRRWSASMAIWNHWRTLSAKDWPSLGAKPITLAPTYHIAREAATCWVIRGRRMGNSHFARSTCRRIAFTLSFAHGQWLTAFCVRGCWIAVTLSLPARFGQRATGGKYRSIRLARVGRAAYLSTAITIRTKCSVSRWIMAGWYSEATRLKIT